MKGGNTLRAFAFPAILILLVAMPAAVFATAYIGLSDNFESYDVGTYLTAVAAAPTPKNDAWTDSNLFTLSPPRYTIVETAELDGNPNNKVAHLYDLDAGNAKNLHLRTNFFVTPYPSSGVYQVTLDVKPLTTNGAYKLNICAGGGWTSAGNWICGVGFGSTVSNAFLAGMTLGNNIGLQTVAGVPGTWADTAFQNYGAEWYTLKFIIDTNLKKYQAYMGPRGGELTELTTGPRTWLVGATTWPTNFSGLYFATSNQTPGDCSEILIDNVACALLPIDRSNWIVWDGFHRNVAANAPGATEDPNHYAWDNDVYPGDKKPTVTGSEMVFPSADIFCDGAFLSNYTPANLDVSIRVRSVGGEGAGIAYRGRSRTQTGEKGNPGFGYRLFWKQDGTSVELAYQWYGSTVASTAYTPATPIDWTVPHVVRVQAIGTSHKVWLDGTKIIDWTNGNYVGEGDIILFRHLSEYHVDDLYMLDTSVSVTSVAAAKSQNVGVSINVSGTGIHVTGAYDGYFYMEDDDRAAGIKVVSTTPVAVGNGVAIKGTIKSANGEKYIEATSVTPDSATVKIPPLAMTNKAHGTGGKLPNIGLLCRIWGKVTYVSPLWDFFYVDDGSGVSYESGKTGIKVYNYDGWVVPSENYYVGCTGVASMDPGGIPVIRMRSSLEDVSIFYPPL